MRCQVYKDIQMQSARRKTIVYECIPDIVLDEYAAPVSDPTGLLELVRQLPPVHGAVVLMRIYLGSTVSETASLLRLSPATVTRRYQEAIDNLRASLSEQ